jgi:hypothetical protein
MHRMFVLLSEYPLSLFFKFAKSKLAEGGGPLTSLNHQAVPAKAEAEGQAEKFKISLKARGGGRVGRGGAG